MIWAVVGIVLLSVLILYALSALMGTGALFLILSTLPGLIVGCTWAVCRKLDEGRDNGARPGGTDRGVKEPEEPK